LTSGKKLTPCLNEFSVYILRGVLPLPEGWAETSPAAIERKTTTIVIVNNFNFFMKDILN
jgi:hypothetical protein